MDALDCPLCFTHYDLDEKKPMVLDCCGYGLCGVCCKQLEDRSGVCPVCRKGWTKAHVNISLIHVINHIKQAQPPDEIDQPSPSDLGLCPHHRHEKQAPAIEYWCKADGAGVCGSCMVNNHWGHEHIKLTSDTMAHDLLNEGRDALSKARVAMDTFRDGQDLSNQLVSQIHMLQAKLGTLRDLHDRVLPALENPDRIRDLAQQLMLQLKSPPSCVVPALQALDTLHAIKTATDKGLYVKSLLDPIRSALMDTPTTPIKTGGILDGGSLWGGFGAVGGAAYSSPLRPLSSTPSTSTPSLLPPPLNMLSSSSSPSSVLSSDSTTATSAATWLSEGQRTIEPTTTSTPTPLSSSSSLSSLSASPVPPDTDSPRDSTTSSSSGSWAVVATKAKRAPPGLSTPTTPIAKPTPTTTSSMTTPTTTTPKEAVKKTQQQDSGTSSSTSSSEGAGPVVGWRKGQISCMLHDLDGFVMVPSNKGSTYCVYFNLRGGRVTTKNFSGFDPSELTIGREVLVELVVNPDPDIVESDKAKAYVARSMKLGGPLPDYPVLWGTVCALYNDHTSGKIKVVMDNREHKVYYNLGGTTPSARLQTINIDDSIDPSKISIGTAVRVQVVPNMDVERVNESKYVARAMKAAPASGKKK